MTKPEANLASDSTWETSSPASNHTILTLNIGSSSIKFSIYEKAESLPLIIKGQITKVDDTSCNFSVKNSKGEQESLDVAARDSSSINNFLLQWLEKHNYFVAIRAVGHRIVHGGQRSLPQLVSESLLVELHKVSAYAPEHLPQQIEMIEAIAEHHLELPQIACFDTAFHRDMPPHAKLLPIPRRFSEAGIERYGFHGLSYAYLLQELERLGDTAATQGRVILAHLGNGASMAAVLNGRSIDTSMCFTPNSGLPMSTRSGDLDPGLINYLLHHEHLDTRQLHQMLNYESGLLGVSETTSDMSELVQQQAEDPRSAEAIAMFCYQAKKCIGAYAAALGGIDTLVFSGGIGEHAPSIRARICADLSFLGIALDEASNEKNSGLISTAESPTRVRVLPTNEELMIARALLPIVTNLPTETSSGR